MTVVYGYSPSGNCHKVRMLLEQLGRAYTWIETDSSRGETRTPAYLAKNPNGQVPMLELEDGRVLVESNAILCFLAADTPLLPDDPWQRAQALRWMFFEQYSHEPNIATVRFWLTHGVEMTPWREESVVQKRIAGYAALDVMEAHLALNRFFVADTYTVADIALYAYTHVAHEGGFDLEPYPSVLAWLSRVAARPGHVAITEVPGR